MNITFSGLNYLARYRLNALTGQTGPVGQHIPGHTDVFINENNIFVNPNSCTFKRNKDNSNFYIKPSVIFQHKSCSTLREFTKNTFTHDLKL